MVDLRIYFFPNVGPCTRVRTEYTIEGGVMTISGCRRTSPMSRVGVYVVTVHPSTHTEPVVELISDDKIDITVIR